MTTGFTISAGRGGGDFDAYIKYMGSPTAFNYLSHTSKYVILNSGVDSTGETIKIELWGAGSNEFFLRGEDGTVLVGINFGDLYYVLIDPSNYADSVLDNMMNAVQSATFGYLTPTIEGILFKGNIGADKFTGKAGADVLNGNGGNDTLAGAKGNDVIRGGSGDDVISGGKGADRLWGNAGADQFVFMGAAALASGDRIADYSSAEGDQIDMRGVDAIAGTSTIDQFTLISTSFTGAAGELRVKFTATGAKVLADATGDGIADFTLTLVGVGSTETISFLLV